MISAPINVAGEYPSHLAKLAKGGFHIVADSAELGKLWESQKEANMLVYVVSGDSGSPEMYMFNGTDSAFETHDFLNIASQLETAINAANTAKTNTNENNQKITDLISEFTKLKDKVDNLPTPVNPITPVQSDQPAQLFGGISNETFIPGAHGDPFGSTATGAVVSTKIIPNIEFVKRGNVSVNADTKSINLTSKSKHAFIAFFFNSQPFMVDGQTFKIDIIDNKSGDVLKTHRGDIMTYSMIQG